MKNRIKEMLAHREMTQRQLAIMLDVSEAQINKWISGKHEPRLLVAQRIADNLGVPIEQVFPKEKPGGN